MSGRLADDTELDSLASLARAVRPLDDTAVTSLLAQARSARDGPATAQLVEQTLGTVLQSVLARRGAASTVELLDLYQEGAVAATVAVGEYAGRGGTATGLRAYVARVVGTFLDDVVARAEAQRVADALFVAQVELLQAAEVTLRRSLGRAPTVLELAGVLQWPADTVELVRGGLAVAADQHDLDLLQYLDDAAEDEQED